MELNKILERDLKLACLIPTHCTEKASCSYCTISTWAYNNTGHAQGTGLPICTPYLSPVRFTHFFSIWPWTRRWVEGVGGKKKKEKKRKKDFSPAVTSWDGIQGSLPPWFTGGEWTWLFLPLWGMLAFLTHVHLTIASGWTAVWMSHIQELIFSVLLILWDILLSNSPM